VCRFVWKAEKLLKNIGPFLEQSDDVSRKSLGTWPISGLWLGPVASTSVFACSTLLTGKCQMQL